ncbi:MAG: LUD domain-containing protein [Actinobacteria bacterium]|nr:LUD domain-containing protein [Actinomycetota bacterium]
MTVEAFTARAESLGIVVRRVPDMAACRTAVAGIIQDAPALVDAIPGLEELAVVVPDDPWNSAVGVSEAFSAAAEAGAVALCQAPGSPRRTSLLPPEHVVIVHADRIRDTYQEMIDDIAALDPPPTGVQVVSGASRSGDIESAMIHGMHGPRLVRFLIVG